MIAQIIQVRVYKSEKNSSELISLKFDFRHFWYNEQQVTSIQEQFLVDGMEDLGHTTSNKVLIF